MKRTRLNRRSKNPRCKECKNKFTPKHDYDFFCSDECISQFAKKSSDKAAKKRESAIKKAQKESRQELNKLKEKNRSNNHGWHEGKLEDKIREIVRLIDKGHKCMSHDGMGQKRNAGHYHSVGANNSLRYHLENIWIQCESCNNFKASNRSGYDKGLVDLYGNEYFLRINQDIVRENPLIKLSIPELKEKIEIANEIIRELKAAGKFFTAQERIELRKEYNKRLNIYKE